MSKHTAGPWRYTSRDIKGIKEWAARMPFAIESTREGVRGGIFPIADVCDQPQAEGNARLIAAAPDLLEALKALVQRREEACAKVGYSPVDGSDDRYARAKAAIAKAEGR